MITVVESTTTAEILNGEAVGAETRGHYYKIINDLHTEVFITIFRH